MSMLNRAGVLAVFFPLAVWSPGYGAESRIAPDRERLDGIKREIRVLNLVDGLELTPDQMARVLLLAREAEGSRAGFRKTIRSMEKDEGMALDEIGALLKQGQAVPQNTALAFHRISNESRKAAIMMRETLKGLIEQAKDILEPHQIYQLEHYVPCIIPPKGEKRIGQAADYKGMSRSLERIRELPGRFYSMRKQAIAQRTIEALKLRAGYGTDGDGQEVLARIASIMDTARRLDSAEFVIQRERLGQELGGLLKPEVPANQLDRKIENFLLSPEMIRILEDKLILYRPNSSRLSGF